MTEIVNTAITGPIRDTTRYPARAGTPDGNPLAIPALVKDLEIERVKQAIQARYGIEATDAYCRDLIAFVEMLTHDHA